MSNNQTNLAIGKAPDSDVEQLPENLDEDNLSDTSIEDQNYSENEEEDDEDREED